jgi:YbbR domain-containing protein
MAWRPLRNIGLKVAALGLGTLLWFTVSSQQMERSVRVPVEYRGVPSALELTGDQTESVYVHLRGPENIISRLEPGDVRAVLDLTRATAVDHGTFPLRIDEIVGPPGAEIMWVEPREVALTLSTVGMATVHVVPAIVGTPAAGFVRGRVTVEPASVDVLGPKDEVSQLAVVTTEPMAIDGLSATFTQSVEIEVPSASLRLRDPRKARVTVEIVKSGTK